MKETSRQFLLSKETLPQRKKILLGHLNANGDCLYATTVARQIKHDYPDCHLTWAISSLCRPILNGNPHVDEVWEIPMASVNDAIAVWPQFEGEVKRRKVRGDFDEVFLTQLWPARLHYYDGSIRSSIFRGYPKPITVPVAPVVRLSPTEVENVRRYAVAHHLTEKGPVILFECSPKSDQSFVTPGFALEVAQKITAHFPDVRVVLSSNLPIHSTDPRIVDGSTLSFRENAELTKYCTMLIGCSSGITWLSTSDWAKPLPMIQLLKANYRWSASVAYDFTLWGLPTHKVIEMTTYSADRVHQCVAAILREGFNLTKSRYHERISVNFDTFEQLQVEFLNKHQFRQSAHLLFVNLKRHGPHHQLMWWLVKTLPLQLASNVKGKLLGFLRNENTSRKRLL